MSCALIQDGKVIGTWPTPPGSIFVKHQLMCKQLFGQKQRYGDHLCVMARRIDPPYVAVRNMAAKRRLVVVNLDNAPADYLAQLCKAYNWPIV